MGFVRLPPAPVPFISICLQGSDEGLQKNKRIKIGTPVWLWIKVMFGWPAHRQPLDIVGYLLWLGFRGKIGYNLFYVS